MVGMPCKGTVQSVEVSHMSKKLVISTLLATACALTASFAFAAPPSSHGPAKDVSSMHESMNHDAHGDAVSAAAKDAKSDDTNVGKAVSPVASDKNNGKHTAKGHTKSHHHH